MKKLFTLALMLFFVGAASAETRMVRLTRYQNKNIRGVDASRAFKVELHYSTDTYAQVEVPAELEDRLIFDLDVQGNIVVGLRNDNRRNDRHTNQLQNMCTAKIYLNDLRNLKVSGAVKVKSYGEFSSDNFRADLSGATSVEGVVLKASGKITIIQSGASNMDATLGAGGFDMDLSGSSRSEIMLNTGNAKFIQSGASRIAVSGNANEVMVDNSGASSFAGENFTSKTAKCLASGASNIKIKATDSFDGDASGAASIRYGGDPTHLNVHGSAAATIKKL